LSFNLINPDEWRAHELTEIRAAGRSAAQHLPDLSHQACRRIADMLREPIKKPPEETGGFITNLIAVRPVATFSALTPK
jgi:hypothetical protein